VLDPVVRRLASDGMRNALSGPFGLDAVHGVVIEETRATDPALEVPQPPDNQAVVESAILDRSDHPHGATFRTRERLRHRCFFSWR